jgi:hypothetical protein
MTQNQQPSQPTGGAVYGFLKVETEGSQDCEKIMQNILALGSYQDIEPQRPLCTRTLLQPLDEHIRDNPTPPVPFLHYNVNYNVFPPEAILRLHLKEVSWNTVHPL